MRHVYWTALLLVPTVWLEAEEPRALPVSKPSHDEGLSWTPGAHEKAAHDSRPVTAKSELDRESIARLVADLDAPRFDRRHAAYERLLEIGDAALPALAETNKSRSAEARFRARRIIALVHTRSLTSQFAQLCRSSDDRLDVERGMWLIARILEPTLDQRFISDELDRWAKRVQERLGTDPPRQAKPAEVAKAFQEVLFGDDGLRGNVANYDAPENSSIAHVLRSRKGLPITLSEITVAIARRLDLPLVGVPTPGRYLVKYDGSRAPDAAGAPQPDLYFSPFERGLILDSQAWRDRFPGVEPGDIKTGNSRDILRRMLANLETHLELHRRPEEAELALRCRLLLDEIVTEP
ncbi:MAG: hypothetical protein RIS70_960 [Planctomycetota bacterium]